PAARADRPTVACAGAGRPGCVGIALVAPSPGARTRNRSSMPQDKFFVGLVAVVSLAFVWILLPFYGAVFWATVLAILFAPMYRRLTRAGRSHRTPAALLTTLLIVLLVILPSVIITG